jgi:hypothetical protein
VSVVVVTQHASKKYPAENRLGNVAVTSVHCWQMRIEEASWSFSQERVLRPSLRLHDNWGLSQLHTRIVDTQCDYLLQLFWRDESVKTSGGATEAAPLSFDCNSEKRWLWPMAPLELDRYQP